MAERLRISFVRHGEHYSGQKNASLTETGMEEARTLGRLIRPEIDRAMGIGFPTRRSMSTLMLAMDPTIENDQVDKRVASSLATGKLRVSSDLTYLGTVYDRFKNSIDQASSVGKGLSFLARDSDHFLDEAPYEISTLSRTSFQVARFIGKCIGRNQSFQDIDSHVVACAREFVYPSFRAKMIEMKEGTDSMHQYAEWYGVNKELVDSVRLDFADLFVDGDVIFGEDPYSQFEMKVDDLATLQSDYLVKAAAKAA